MKDYLEICMFYENQQLYPLVMPVNLMNNRHGIINL